MSVIVGAPRRRAHGSNRSTAASCTPCTTAPLAQRILLRVLARRGRGHGTTSPPTATPPSTTPWRPAVVVAALPARGRAGQSLTSRQPVPPPRYTECKTAPRPWRWFAHRRGERRLPGQLHGRNQEPVILPSRFPQPPGQRLRGHRGAWPSPAQPARDRHRRPVVPGATPPARRQAVRGEALIERVPGPDLFTGATHPGAPGIEDAYRTGRGSITQRAVVSVEEIQVASAWWSPSCPTRSTPDNLAGTRSPSLCATAGRRHRRHPTRLRAGLARGCHRARATPSPRSSSTTSTSAPSPGQLPPTCSPCRRAAHPEPDGLCATAASTRSRSSCAALLLPAQGRERLHILEGLLKATGRARRRHRPHPPLAHHRGGAGRGSWPARRRRGPAELVLPPQAAWPPWSPQDPGERGPAGQGRPARHHRLPPAPARHRLRVSWPRS